MPQVIVQSGGYTYKHPKAAKAGDLWIGMYKDKRVVLVTDVYQRYIKFLDVHIKEIDQSSFYSLFEKLED